MLMRLFALVVISGLMIGSACRSDDEESPAATGTVVGGTPTVAAPVGTPGTAAPTTPAATPSSPLITIDLPVEDAAVAVPVSASGTANTFEAALTVDVVDAEGEVLCVRNILATSGSGTPGTWATTLAFPPPDSAMLATIRAYEFSAMDGSIINRVERPITISTERPPLLITSPVCGATVSSGGTLVVEGAGVVFEAAFQLELRDAAGMAVVSERGMAGGTEELPFTVSLAIPAELAAGRYDLVAFSLSARDGAIENEFSVQVVVEP